LVTDVFGFIGVLISFWDQKFKASSASNDMKNWVNTIAL